MESRKLQIPGGMQDTLPGECAHKRRLEGELRQLFTLNGYQEIETPILEYYDANDCDQNQLGKGRDFPLTDDQIQDAMKDNPSGQGDELTPFILIRPIKA